MARPATAAARLLSAAKEPVRAASTANIDLAAGGLLTVDGVTLEAGDRVLAKSQTDASQNGVYDASAGEWVRSADSRASRTLDKGMTVHVQAGTVNADRIYVFDTLDPDLGTDAISLVQLDLGSGGIPDAPSDGDLYVRQDGAWVALDYATIADVRASASGQKIVTADLIEGASALAALTDGANIAFDWDAGLNRTVTLGGNRTLDNPTNGQPGTWRTVIVTQDGAGNRTLAFGNQYRFEAGEAPVLSAAIGAVDVLSILCVSATSFFVFSAFDMQA